jgi:uncharacterized DUF497 family protein
MKLKVSHRVSEKLRDKHKVTMKEIAECFQNRQGRDLFDTRARHQTDPKTRWFLACTNHDRLLKIVFMPDVANRYVEIKSAYEPNDEEVRIYKKYGLA